MTVERNRFVLRENVDSTDIRVDAVAQGEIDDSIDATKGNGGLCSVFRQGIEPLPLSSRKNHSKYLLHDCLRNVIPAYRFVSLFWVSLISGRDCEQAMDPAPLSPTEI